MESDADRIVRRLALAPHPEGGFYRELFRDEKGPHGRAHSTAIYYLLRAGEASRWHRIDTVEVWHWYSGAPLELLTSDGKGKERTVIGNEFANGEVPVAIVPANAWQSARSLGAYTLCGCTVAPGFEFATFELAPAGWHPG